MEYNLKVNMNEYLPLRDVVFNTLRDAILKGELEPGERLMEIQLAERLGAVSYTHLDVYKRQGQNGADGARPRGFFAVRQRYRLRGGVDAGVCAGGGGEMCIRDSGHRPAAGRASPV